MTPLRPDRRECRLGLARAARAQARAHHAAGALAMVALIGLMLSGCDALTGAKGLVDSGRAALAEGNAQLAMTRAKRAIEKNGGLVDARLLLIDAALAQNDFDTATEQLEKARAQGARAIDLSPREWALLRARNDYQGLLRSVSQASPEVPEGVRRRFEGQAQLGTGHVDEAVAAFRRALALDSGDIDAQIGLAQAYLKGGDKAAAVASLKSALAAHANSAKLALALGQAERAAGNLAEASEAFKSAAALSSPHGDFSTWFVASANLAELAITEGHYAEADTLVAALVKGAPKMVATRQLQARLALAERHLDDAARYAQSLVSAVPNDLPSRMLLAYVTYAQGYLQQTETSLDLVLSEHPDYVPARKLLAEIQLATKRAELARHTIDPLLGPTADGETLALAGEIATANGETAEAEGYFSRALEGSGASDALKLKIAAQYLSTGKRNRAVEILARLPGGTDLSQRRDLLLALATASTQSPEQARATIDAVASKYADDGALQRSVALLQAARGDPDAARDRLKNWLKSHPDDADAYLVLGRTEGAAHRYDESANALREVLKRQPKNVGALTELAALSLLSHDVDGAVKLLETARAADPKAIEPRLRLARLYLGRDGSGAQGLALAQPPLKEALALAPNRVDALILSAVAEKRLGHDAEAERILTDALKADASSPTLWLSLGELQAAGNHLAEARESFKKALSVQPGWLPAVRALAAVDVRQGEYADALDATFKAREVSGQSAADAREQRAGALLLEGDVHATAAAREPARAKESWLLAAQSYAKANDIYPSLGAALRLLRARVLGGLNEPEVPLANWLRQHPSDIVARGTLGNYYADRKDLAKAISTYEEGLTYNPTDGALLNNLAWVYFLAHDPRALDTARKALQYSQRQPSILDTLGWILFQSDKAGEGTPLLAEAHKGAPRNPEISYHYAAALAKGGKPADAAAILTDTLKDPRQFPSRHDAELLYAGLGGAGPGGTKP